MSISRLAPDRTADAIELLARMARAANVDVATLRGHGRFSKSVEYVVIRRAFCMKGREIGLRVQELGIALNRCYTTIVYNGSEKIRARKILTRTRPTTRRYTSEQKYLRKLYDAGITP